jgi:hypothetical protein
VRQARRFFGPNSTIEILEELLPDVSPYNLTHTFNITMIMGQFLPTDEPPVMPDSMPENTPAFYWVPTLFSLWSYFSNSPSFDILIVELLSRLAEAQVGNPGRVMWNEEQVKLIFAAGLRMLDLPVGTASMGMGGRSLKLSGNLSDLLDSKVSLWVKLYTRWHS